MLKKLKEYLIRKTYLGLYMPGHYYSPIPNLKEIKQDEERLFRLPNGIDGIDLNENGQKEFLRAIRSFINETRYPVEQFAHKRYYTHNDYFVESDALYYEAMINLSKPKKIIEVGSGFSSAVLVDAIDRYALKLDSIHFIEPYPERLIKLFNEADKTRYELHEKRVQDISVDLFTSLNAGDILFIDSSHVAKIGSDVNFLVFKILPRLKPGVLIHVHDILYPFEYPKEWVFEGRFWNEAYLLKAFLMFNSDFKIIIFNDYLAKCQQSFLKEIDGRLLAGGGSLWIQKM